MANRVYEEGQRTLEAIANHASRIETNMGLEKIFRPDERKKAQKKGTNDTDSNSKNVSSITTTTGHHSDSNPQCGNTSRGRSQGTQRGAAFKLSRVMFLSNQVNINSYVDSDSRERTYL